MGSDFEKTIKKNFISFLFSSVKFTKGKVYIEALQEWIWVDLLYTRKAYMYV